MYVQARAAQLALGGAHNGMTATGQPGGGSFTAGGAVAVVGVAFVGVAAVTTQLASSTRAASGLARRCARGGVPDQRGR
jgi:hypothetical protein